jgi:hypothetical protein
LVMFFISRMGGWSGMALSPDEAKNGGVDPRGTIA